MGVLKEIKKNWNLYLLAVPGILFLIIFAYIPLFGHILAFKEYKLSDGLWGSKWVGLKNFAFFFGGHDWLTVTSNTLFLNTLFLSFGLTFAVILAVFLNEIKNVVLKKFAQSVVFLPFFISWLVVSIMLGTMLNSSGIINQLLQAMHLGTVSWYMTPRYWPTILVLVNVWRFAGYNSIIFLAAITAISPELYESSALDSATKFQQLIYITLPLLRPTFIIMFLLGVGRIFYGDFGMIYSLVGDNGVLYSTTDVIDTYSYRALRYLGSFSMSSAIVLYQSLMGLITISLFNFIVKKVEPESSLF